MSTKTTKKLNFQENGTSIPDKLTNEDLDFVVFNNINTLYKLLINNYYHLYFVFISIMFKNWNRIAYSLYQHSACMTNSTILNTKMSETLFNFNENLYKNNFFKNKKIKFTNYTTKSVLWSKHNYVNTPLLHKNTVISNTVCAPFDKEKYESAFTVKQYKYPSKINFDNFGLYVYFYRIIYKG